MAPKMNECVAIPYEIETGESEVNEREGDGGMRSIMK